MAPVKAIVMQAVTEQDRERLEPFSVEKLAMRAIKLLQASVANRMEYQQKQGDRIRRLCKQAIDCPTCKPIY